MVRGVEDTLPHTERVKSSDGEHEYVVTITEDYTAHCDCVGFYHRRYCRHIREVLERLIENVDRKTQERNSGHEAGYSQQPD